MGRQSKSRWVLKKRGPYAKRSEDVASQGTTSDGHAPSSSEPQLERNRKRAKPCRQLSTKPAKRPGDGFMLLDGQSESYASLLKDGLLSDLQEYQGVMHDGVEALPSSPHPERNNTIRCGESEGISGLDIGLSVEQDNAYEAEESEELIDSMFESASGGIRLTWTNIASLITATGSTRLSETAYQTLANFRNWRPNERQLTLKLPSTSTLKRRVRPFAKSNFFVPCHVEMFTVDLSKSGSKAGVGKYTSQDSAPTMIVRPSNWAKLDFSTAKLREMVQGRRHDMDPSIEIPRFSDIEDTPIIKDRAGSLSVYRIPTEDGVTVKLRKGLLLNITVETSDAVKGRLMQAQFAVTSSTNMRFHAVVSSFFVYDEPNWTEPQAESNSKRTKTMKTKRPESRAFLPSDMVVELALPGQPDAEDSEEPTQTPFLVYRMWRRQNCDDDYATSLVVSSERNVSNLTGTNRGVYNQMFDKTVVKRVSADDNPMNKGHRVDAESSGRLEDGRKYVVYRMFLYSDGFTPYIGKKGSMGGVYMLPIGMAPENRNGAGAIRPIGLTPPGVSTNEVLAAVIDDIIEGTEKGFEMTTAKGEKVVLFLDVVGYVGDYPAVSHTLDLLGHCSNVPCHLCSYGRYDKSGFQGSKYCYTTRIHSDHPSFARDENRATALRRSKLSREELKALGMDDADTFETSLQALHQLSEKLRQVRARVPRVLGSSKPVVPSVFDSYRSCVVAPDHLFLGIGRDIMNLCITLLPKDVRKDAEAIAKMALKDGYLIYQESLINHDKHVLHSMTISSMYCLLLVAPRAMKSAWYVNKNTGERESGNCATIDEALDLLDLFSSLVSRTQYFPDSRIDGKRSLDTHNEEGGTKRLLEIRNMALRYLSRVDKLCRTDSFASTHLDKPNLHRLLEFFTHTLPLFGSVRHVQELLFESAHQPLKRGVAQSNMKNSQLQAMEHRLANDWKTRLAIETEGIDTSENGWSFETAKSVLNLLGYDSSGLQDAGRFLQKLQDCFPTPVLQNLRLHRKGLLSSSLSRKDWRVDNSVIMNLGNTADGGQHSEMLQSTDLAFLLKAREFLEHLWKQKLRLRSGRPDHGNSVTVQIYGTAKWCKITDGRKRDQTSVLATISYGSVIQALHSSVVSTADPDLTFTLHENNDSEHDEDRRFWMVLAVVQVRILDAREKESQETTRYCAVKECEAEEDGYGVMIQQRNERRALVELGSYVRKALVMHYCEQDSAESGDHMCLICTSNSAVQHRSLPDGGIYQVWGRKEGYPPRQA